MPATRLYRNGHTQAVPAPAARTIGVSPFIRAGTTEHAACAASLRYRGDAPTSAWRSVCSAWLTSWTLSDLSACPVDFSCGPVIIHGHKERP